MCTAAGPAFRQWMFFWDQWIVLVIAILIVIISDDNLTKSDSYSCGYIVMIVINIIIDNER